MSEKTTEQSASATYYAVGKRDALAEILMQVRLHGERKALRDVANQLNAALPDGHCHAKWYLENHPPVE
jgi:hypothetical protein